MIELEHLYSENQFMRKLNTSLNSKLKKFKIKEKALIELVQVDKGFSGDILDQIDKKYSGIIEIGRKKVKIPILDLSRIEYDVSDDESENSKYNINNIQTN